MLAIPMLTTWPKFPWITCETSDCATMSTHERQRKKAVEAEAGIGFDDTTSPWTLDSPSNNLVSPVVQDLEDAGTTSKRKREDEIADQIRVRSLLSALVARHRSHHQSFPLGLSRNSIT